MALVIPTGFAQASIPLKNQFVLRPAVITFGVDLVGSTAPTPQDEADVILSVFQDAFSARIDPSVTVGPVSLYTQEGGSGGSVEGTDTFIGTRAANNATPPQIAVIVRKQTSRIGRPGRGRFFLPWVLDRDDVQEDGQISADEVTALQSAADEFLENLTLSNANMVLLHGDDIPGSTAPSTVTGLIVDSQSGTQRRRNR